MSTAIKSRWAFACNQQGHKGGNGLADQLNGGLATKRTLFCPPSTGTLSFLFVGREGQDKQQRRSRGYIVRTATTASKSRGQGATRCKWFVLDLLQRHPLNHDPHLEFFKEYFKNIFRFFFVFYFLRLHSFLPTTCTPAGNQFTPP